MNQHLVFVDNGDIHEGELYSLLNVLIFQITKFVKNLNTTNLRKTVPVSMSAKKIIFEASQRVFGILILIFGYSSTELGIITHLQIILLLAGHDDPLMIQ